MTSLFGKPNPFWQAILEEIAKLEKDKKLTMSMRGTGYSRDVGGVHESWVCTYKGYPNINEPEKHVYEIYAYKSFRGQIYTKVEGPYVDSSDEYWLGMAEHDKAEGNALVTDKWTHYTVHKNSPHPGQGDGYGGSEFKFVILHDDVAKRLKELGLKVEDFTHDGEDWYRLTTRNLWHQGVIPKAHRHLFSPNCKML